MVTQSDVRRLALALPETSEAPTGFSFAVQGPRKPKGFVWVWMERTAPRRPRVPNAGVLAVRVTDVAQRDLMIAAAPAKFFTEPHYDGFPAVLVRLDAIDLSELEILIESAWRCLAPRRLHDGVG